MEPSTTFLSTDITGDAAADHECQDGLYHRAVAEVGGALGRIAIAYEANPAQQQDLLQEIHIALWRSLPAFKGECLLRTWVYRVAHNTATTYALRRKRHRVSKWISLEDVEELVDPADSSRSIDEQSVRERVVTLIGNLRALDRDILLLYLEGLGAKEIAEIVGLAPSNVAQRIHRGKKILTSFFQTGAKS